MFLPLDQIPPKRHLKRRNIAILPKGVSKKKLMENLTTQVITKVSASTLLYGTILKHLRRKGSKCYGKKWKCISHNHNQMKHDSGSFPCCTLWYRTEDKQRAIFQLHQLKITLLFKKLNNILWSMLVKG